jgi:hypothetical protein
MGDHDGTRWHVVSSPRTLATLHCSDEVHHIEFYERGSLEYVHVAVPVRVFLQAVRTEPFFMALSLQMLLGGGHREGHEGML